MNGGDGGEGVVCFLHIMLRKLLIEILGWDLLATPRPSLARCLSGL